MQWLITFRQLSSYMFSGEGSFANGADSDFLSGGIDHKRRQSYVVASESMPPQATVLGAVRYLLLMDKGLLKTNWKYEDKKDMDQLIGAKSFSLNKDATNDMGVIDWISPVFLLQTDENGKPATAKMPAPLDCAPKTANDNRYTPMTDNSPDKIWKLNEFDAKDFPKPGFISCDIVGDGDKYRFGEISDGWTATDAMYGEHELPGIRIPQFEGDDNKSYHVQKRKWLKDTCFAVVVNLTDDDRFKERRSAVVSMGGRGSMFHVEIHGWGNVSTKQEDGDACEWFNMPQPKLNEGHRAYLLSPSRLPKEKLFEHALITTCTVRTGKSTGRRGVELSDTRYRFADTGSVFFFNDGDLRNKFIEALREDKAFVAGYNHAVAYGEGVGDS